MPTLDHVAAIARIATLTTDPDRPAGADAAARVLAHAFRGDASSLVTLDPVSGAHRAVAEVDYPRQVGRCLTVEFPRSPWFDIVLAERMPPSISRQVDQSFRQGELYQQVIEPAGFRDGMTAALRHDGRYVGLVHLSSAAKDRFDDVARATLQAMAPALAVLVDPFRSVGSAPTARSGRTQPRRAAVVDGRVVELPGRQRPTVLTDVELRELIAGFEAGPGDRLRIVWPVEHQWHRVHLERSAELGVVVTEWARPLPYQLTDREIDVLTRVSLGQSNRAIAEELVVSVRTVHTHLEHLLRKTGAAGRARLCALALHDGLVRPSAPLLAANPWWGTR